MPSDTHQLSFLNPSLSLQAVRSGSSALGKDASARRGFAAMIGLLMILAIGSFVTVSRVPPEIPLHYSRPWGTAQLVSRDWLWWLAAGGALSTLLHTLTATLLYQHNQPLARSIIWSGCLLILFFLLATATVYLRVGR